MANVEALLKKQKCIRVFGYGSLIWKPEFEYDNIRLGYIEGYERRFWQGSSHHRGTVEKTGRVLTLTKQEKGRCWGLVYEVNGSDKIEATLDYLETRERRLGGYDIVIVPVIIPALGISNNSIVSILYYATPENDLYLGENSLSKIAQDIATSRGVSGHNAEYLIRLADFMRASVPQEHEHHLFQLDQMVRVKLGLGSNNILPWTSLVTMETFHKRLLRTESEEDECSDNASTLIQPVVLA